MVRDFTIIRDGRKFIVIDQRGDPKFDSYWEQECHDWIAEDAHRHWNDDDDY